MDYTQVAVNGRPWFWRLEYVSDGTEPAGTDIWIYMHSGDNYRRSYYFSKSTVRPYYFKAWYRFSLEEEEVSTLYYGVARMDICPNGPWLEDPSVDIINDGSSYTFSFYDFYTDEAKAYLDDPDYVAACKLEWNFLNYEQSRNKIVADSTDPLISEVYS
jgi:hypothetical protein